MHNEPPLYTQDFVVILKGLLFQVTGEGDGEELLGREFVSMKRGREENSALGASTDLQFSLGSASG